jgi:hypothetical protein
MVSPNPDLPELIKSEFKISRWRFEVHVPKKAIPLESIDLLKSVTVRPDEPLNVSGVMCPIVVFTARLRRDLKLEQIGEGFPCKTESEAETICEAIQAKNRKTPSVGLASWSGNFTLGTISGFDFFREELVLFKFSKPVILKDVRCGYALRIYRHYVDRREKIWEQFLPTTNAKVAEKALAEKGAELAAEKSAKTAEQKRDDSDLTSVKLKVLSKAYPKTIAHISNPDPKNAEAAYAAYKQETLAATGHLIGTLEKNEFASVAKLLRSASRRKNPALNLIDFQLVVGWRLHGYDRMSPEERFKKLKQLGFSPASPDAVRKACERLKLPSLRKRGAPRKNASEK